MDFGDDVMEGGSDAQRRKKRYHRHTPRQIQQLEAYVHPASPADLLFYWLVVSVRFGCFAQMAAAFVCACACAQDVQGVPAPGREPADAAEPGAGAGAPADQVLVSEPPDADEGIVNLPLLLPLVLVLYLGVGPLFDSRSCSR